MFASAPSAPHTIEFCRSIAASETPIEVPHLPLLHEPHNECVSIVPKHVLSFGGEQVLGWAIWERPGVFIEAEFHAIWRNPAGECIDLTPRPQYFKTITFLPDPTCKYNGRQIDNIRKALAKDIDVTRFLFLAKRRFEILNTGDLADQHGSVTLPKKLEREYLGVVKELVRLENRIAKRYPQ